MSFPDIGQADVEQLRELVGELTARLARAEKIEQAAMNYKWGSVGGYDEYAVGAARTALFMLLPGDA